MSDESKCPRCGGFRNLPRILHEDPDNPRECDDKFHREAEVIKFPTPEEQEQKPPAETPAPAQVPMVANPVCPHCGLDPANLKGRTMKMGPYELLLVRCANEDCRKTIAVFPIGYNGPAEGPGKYVQ